MKNFILLAVILAFSSLVFAQDQDSTNTKKRSKLTFIPLPVIAANPTAGWMFGIAPSASMFFGDPPTTHISSGLGTVIYTTKKQLILTAKTNIFLSDDSWNLLGDWRYFITSQPTYGLGTGPQSGKPIGTGIEYADGLFSEPIPDDQMMEFNYFRLHQSVLKRVKDSRFFVGLGYHLDYHWKIKDNLLNLDTVPPIITSHYAYSITHGIDPEKYTTSGISLNALFDSRDNAINPYSGRYAFINFKISPQFLGSSKSSTLLWLEYRDYLHLSKTRPRHLIAFWTYGWFLTSGEMPFLDLPAVGWDQFGRSGRAYTQGRFRGEDLIYGEVEYRFPLQKDKETFGGVIFVNTTTASNRLANIDLFNYLNLGYGVGLRIMVSKKSRTNLNIDYAWGDYGASGFYLGINEVF